MQESDLYKSMKGSLTKNVERLLAHFSISYAIKNRFKLENRIRNRFFYVFVSNRVMVLNHERVSAEKKGVNFSFNKAHLAMGASSRTHIYNGNCMKLSREIIIFSVLRSFWYLANPFQLEPKGL